MKTSLLCFVLFLTINTNAQTITELQTAISSSGNAVQAIHHYPKSIKEGCHNVPTTSIAVDGQSIIITETWTDNWNNTAQTVLKGSLNGQQATGSWKSSYSSGIWSYDFTTGTGKWNKTKAPMQFGTFSDFQILEFRIVNRSALFDGFRACK